MKQKLSEYIKANYMPGSEPDPRTVVSRANKGLLSGVSGACLEGGLWYVYLSSTAHDSIIASIEREIQCRL